MLVELYKEGIKWFYDIRYHNDIEYYLYGHELWYKKHKRIDRSKADIIKKEYTGSKNDPIQIVLEIVDDIYGGVYPVSLDKVKFQKGKYFYYGA